MLTAQTTGVSAFALQQRLGDEPVARTDPLLGVDDEQDRIGVGDLALDPALHPLGEGVARALDAGQVGEDQLPAGLDVRGHAPDRAAGGLRPLGDDRHAGADDRVDQGRLADVRPPRDPDESSLAHRRRP